MKLETGYPIAEIDQRSPGILLDYISLILQRFENNRSRQVGERSARRE